MLARLVCVWFVLSIVLQWADAAAPPPPSVVNATVVACNQTNVFITVAKPTVMQFATIQWDTDPSFSTGCSVLVSSNLLNRPTPASDANNNYYYYEVEGGAPPCDVIPCLFYYFRAAVAQAVGFTGSSPFVDADDNPYLQTLEPEPPTITSITPLGTSCGAVLSLAPGELFTGCTQTGGNCTVFFATDPSMSDEVAITTVGDELQVTLAPLVAGQPYFVQALCRNSCGTASNRTAIAVLIFPGPTAPGNLTAVQVFDGGLDPQEVDLALVSWQVPPNTAPILDICNLTISELPDLSDPTFVTTGAAPAGSYSALVGLDVPGTLYFQVTCSSICGGTLSPASEIESLSLFALAGAPSSCTQSFIP